MSINTYPDQFAEVLPESDSPKQNIIDKSEWILHSAIDGDYAEDLNTGSRFCTLLGDPLDGAWYFTIFDKVVCPYSGDTNIKRSTRPFRIPAFHTVQEIVDDIRIIEPRAVLVCDEVSAKDLFAEIDPQVAHQANGTMQYEGDLPVLWVDLHLYTEDHISN